MNRIISSAETSLMCSTSQIPPLPSSPGHRVHEWIELLPRREPCSSSNNYSDFTRNDLPPYIIVEDFWWLCAKLVVNRSSPYSKKACIPASTTDPDDFKPTQPCLNHSPFHEAGSKNMVSLSYVESGSYSRFGPEIVEIEIAVYSIRWGLKVKELIKPG